MLNIRTKALIVALALSFAFLSNAPAQTPRPKLGVALLPAKMGGMMIAEVLANTPAEDAGLQAGEVILTINGNFINSLDDVRNEIAAAGNDVNLILFDGSRFVSLTVPLISPVITIYLEHGSTATKVRPKTKPIRKVVADPRRR
jgi:S1-C subfamily serine protease